MIIVVSPAKALDFESPWATQKSSKPALLKKSEELVGVLSQKSPDQLGSLMSLSDSLGELNFERYPKNGFLDQSNCRADKTSCNSQDKTWLGL